jgi:hypothetical protein
MNHELVHITTMGLVRRHGHTKLHRAQNAPIGTRGQKHSFTALNLPRYLQKIAGGVVHPKGGHETHRSIVRNTIRQYGAKLMGSGTRLRCR